jgi:hypothetical protein
VIDRILYLLAPVGARPIAHRVHVLSHTVENGDTQINAGPTIFRESCDTCIHFASGAALSFGITLRLEGEKTTLLSYRFYLHLIPASGISIRPHRSQRAKK